jgi:hypothetical protein
MRKRGRRNDLASLTRRVSMAHSARRWPRAVNNPGWRFRPWRPARWSTGLRFFHFRPSSCGPDPESNCSAISGGAEQGLRGHSTPDRSGTYILPQSSPSPRNKGFGRTPEASAKAPKPFRNKDLPRPDSFRPDLPRPDLFRPDLFRPDLFRTNLQESDRLRNNAGNNQGINIR